ncbi:hypothetical protein SGL43_06810 [Streptomyces globisporus]|uniref:Uncharacterized protein n=1 Tax=Streptomyces globisporus TaxID=1908 RepID=A0ABN8VAC0_STRGL|nr:hypothetical protein SGL43_06810 [Streptomyces globisporus]
MALGPTAALTARGRVTALRVPGIAPGFLPAEPIAAADA